MKNIAVTLMAVGMFAVMMVVALPAALWQAFAIQVLWGWFATPIFGIPAPSIFAIAGLWLIPNTLVAPLMRTWENQEGKKKLGTIALYWALGPAILLAGGWFYRIWAF